MGEIGSEADSEYEPSPDISGTAGNGCIRDRCQLPVVAQRNGDASSAAPPRRERECLGAYTPRPRERLIG